MKVLGDFDTVLGFQVHDEVIADGRQRAFFEGDSDEPLVGSA
jgi:hypothetical protein